MEDDERPRENGHTDLGARVEQRLDEMGADKPGSPVHEDACAAESRLQRVIHCESLASCARRLHPANPLRTRRPHPSGVMLQLNC